MIVPSMSPKEIVKHIRAEIGSNNREIQRRIFIEATQMRISGRRIHSYRHAVGFQTPLTIYIYGIDKEGVDYAVGCWYRSEGELCWVTPGAIGVQLFTAHFFKRYAERYLKRELSVFDSAMEYYKRFTNSASRNTREILEGVFKTQLPTCDGLALGECDFNNGFAFYRTFVSKDDLFHDQIEDIQADSELNNFIQSIDTLQFKQVVETWDRVKSHFGRKSK